jgi:hypothetical protein
MVSPMFFIINSRKLSQDHELKTIENGLDLLGDEESSLHTLIIHGLPQDWMEEVGMVFMWLLEMCL